MIIGRIHQGSGLGNQLHRYVMTRVIAMDKEFDWGFIGVENFKGHTLFDLEWGNPPEDVPYYFEEKRVNNEKGDDIRGYDFEGIKNIEDETIVDGEFQGEDYYKHHKDKIRSWFATEPIDLGDNVCVIGFRGGEYSYFPNLFLTQKYWNDAIANMLKRNPDMIFKVVTDDVATAQVFFPHYEVTHEISRDWRMIRSAKNLIIANSSFFIFPAWLNEDAYIIAPKWWARHNLGFWALEQNKYKSFNYQDHDGNLEQI